MAARSGSAGTRSAGRGPRGPRVCVLALCCPGCLIPLQGPAAASSHTSLVLRPQASPGRMLPGRQGHAVLLRGRAGLVHLYHGYLEGPHEPSEASARAAGLRKPLNDGWGWETALGPHTCEDGPGTDVLCSMGKAPRPSRGEGEGQGPALAVAGGWVGTGSGCCPDCAHPHHPQSGPLGGAPPGKGACAAG